MPVVEFSLETSASPESVRSALIDFSAHRPQVWPGITASQYEVYSVDETTAEVKEGTGRFWAREHYDWSDPDTVRWTVQRSNFCTPGSFVTATVLPRDGGGSRIHIHWERTPTSLPGKLAARVIVLTKGKPVASSFKKSLRKPTRLAEVRLGQCSRMSREGV